MDKEKPKFFISYAREDMGVAKRLFGELGMRDWGLGIWDRELGIGESALNPAKRWRTGTGGHAIG